MTLGRSIETDLTDLLALLRRHGVDYATVIHELVAEVRRTPDCEIPKTLADRLRGLYGGMGTLNDVWISRANGDVVEDEESANRELDTLRSRLWKDVSRL